MKTSVLLEKYCKSGPRYTSYPPAPHFHTGFNDVDWRHELETNQNSERGISLYAHIPFCDTLCWYCGCNMVATRDYGRVQNYLEILFKEIDWVAELVAPTRGVRQIHWGGGTPTYLHPEDMARLFEHLISGYTIDPCAEVGCEADPRELTQEHVRTLKHLGFNRISLGVQDLDERVQQAVNRIQPESLIREVYGWMRDAGFESINMDLMLGLPYQTIDTFAKTLDEIIDMRPDRLAVFNYAHVPWMKKHQKLIPETALPDVQTRIVLQEYLLERLTAAGYLYIGMDHYALPGDELVAAQRNKTLYRNFQGYTTHKNCDVLAFGASAISQTEEVYVQNVKKLSEYRERIQSGRLATERGIRVGREDKLRREAITRIMCNLELDMGAFGEEWNIDCNEYFGCTQMLVEMADDGLLNLQNGIIKVTDIGRLFLRNIAMLFDGYLRQSSAEEVPRYSKTL